MSIIKCCWISLKCRVIADTSISSSFRETGNSLYTDSLTSEDEGKYICFTRNVAGNCTYTIDLKTQDPRTLAPGM